MAIPSRQQMNQAWNAICDVHREHLPVHGVKLPKEGTNKWVWLTTLWHNRPAYVHKDEISEAVRSIIPTAATDKQVRHLKRDGWKLISGKDVEGQKLGEFIIDWFNPSAEFVNQQARRRGRLQAGDFEDLKEVYGNRCATCGATEGRPDPRYGDDKVELQQGHQDPDGPSDDPENLIPQCQFCNRAYKDNFVFDNKGRVRTIATLEPVKLASPQVQDNIFEYLRKLRRAR